MVGLDSVSRAVTYRQGSGDAFYEEWNGSKQFTINFDGEFTDSDGETYTKIQLRLSKTAKNIVVQALKQGVGWFNWFTINGS